jgi:Glucose-6-phosphate dehydrogenase, NAD binding domain
MSTASDVVYSRPHEGDLAMETPSRHEGVSAFAPDGASVAPPCAMVIFGAAGDLTKRLIVPALYNLVNAGRLPNEFQLVGIDLASKTAAQAAAAGATSIVAGSAIFGAKDYAGAIAAIRAHATAAAAQA